jgi:four helix bundle protein
LSETLNHLIDAQDEEYIDEKIFRELEEQYHAVEALLNGYISYLRSKFEQ